MFLFRSVWLILPICYLLDSIYAQASPENPFIWQILTEYDLSESNKTKTYLPETSMKVYSQDFQTVFENKDRFGHNERLVLDLGDACNETTIEDIERYNGNWATSPSMMSQPSIALVQRGGRCLKWSEKIANVQSLSNTYRLQLSGMVIYDNIYYNDTNFIQENTYDPSYPTWPAPLPNERNIKYMTEENVIDSGKTFLAVYFVPLSYMNFLNKTLLSKTFQRNGTKQIYTQLTFSLKEKHFVTMSDPSGTSSSDDDINSNPDNLWDAERERRNYIIYSVTAAVVIVLVYVIARWCRAVRRPIANDLENNGRGDNMLLRTVRSEERHVIPFLELSNLCPIQKYDETSMTNSTCAICLDDFKDDFYVRVLPCNHGYCTACIDVWLTKKSSLCPICKYDCKEFLRKSDGDEHESVVNAEATPSNT